MKRVCVFAGSNPGSSPEYRESAILLGRELVKKRLELVYGGSSVGLMGEIANTVLERGGIVIGVMPRNLFRKEVVHRKLTNLHEVNDMHERKAKMGELSDAFVALPGGFGTLEEIFEIVSWGQIGIHQKPIGMLNVAGYYDPLIEMIEKGVKGGFIPPSNGEMIVCETNPALLLEKLYTYKPPQKSKWSNLA
ncbi:LOG family protein [Thermoactinomyces mirandus]|uniref:Cytokinin riboside 5'-monophosphate phosphoribohydrolase n=1 Tax=Thermoactinomyces mirandus TaxID=2756294 RepID=A0A7W1XT01_9BACL|nr:TIGR00730 family Rossman fold protein [Thermoactinomyces mirandus]MBA4602655.1 TIGR00730 family Rossman fold protein [Thermoactinomyces mirandus]